MNYYEELGLSESSSVEEIHQAYKSLVRLLHPDRQREEQLRKIAELQLIRLNQILEVLTDPLLRLKYDESIRLAARPASEMLNVLPGWRRPFSGHFRIDLSTILWGAALVLAAVGFSFTLLFFKHGPAIAGSEGSTQRPTRSSQEHLPAKPQPQKLRPRSERRTKPVLQARIPVPFTAAPPEGPRMEPLQAIPLVADVPNPIAPLSAAALPATRTAPGSLWLARGFTRK